MFIFGMIVGGILVAAYFYDKEQDERAPRREFDDSPDVVAPQNKGSKEEK